MDVCRYVEKEPYSVISFECSVRFPCVCQFGIFSLRRFFIRKDAIVLSVLAQRRLHAANLKDSWLNTYCIHECEEHQCVAVRAPARFEGIKSQSNESIKRNEEKNRTDDRRVPYDKWKMTRIKRQTRGKTNLNGYKTPDTRAQQERLQKLYSKQGFWYLFFWKYNNQINMSSPSWLSTSAPAAAAPATIDPLSIESNNDDAAAGTSASTDEKDLPSIILMMRLLNMGAAAGLITVSVRTKRTVGIMSSSEGHWSKKFDLCKRENANLSIGKTNCDLRFNEDLSASFVYCI